MRRRFEINDEGQLVDRHGYVLGRITSITLETTGDYRGGVDLQEEQRQGEEEKTTPVGPQALFEEGAAAERDEIAEVWAHYVEVMKPRDPTLHPAERAVIRDALKVATAVELKRAITACSRSDFHMGKNERGRKYNSLSQIIKGKRGKRTTREQIDFFLDMLASDELPSGLTSEAAAKIARAKDEVRRGVGREAARRKLLDEYGIESEFVERPGRPGVWVFREVSR